MKEFLDYLITHSWIHIKEISPDKKTVTITVEFRAKPGAKTNQLKFKDGILSVFIKERPIDGEANLGFINFFSELLETPKNHVELVYGHKGKTKRLQITMTGKGQSWLSRIENIKRLLSLDLKE